MRTFPILFASAGLILSLGSSARAAAGAAAPVMTDGEIAQVCGGAPATAATVPDRMPVIPTGQLTDAQKEAQAEFTKSRGGENGAPIFGPYVALLRSPEVLLDTERLGTYLQFRSVLPPKIRQFIMAITARQWSQEYMWGIHCPQVLKAGISVETAKALADGRTPAGMPEDEETVYDFVDELHRNQSVSDATYARALAKFGEQGVIDMIALNGYYTSIAMVLNATRHPVNKGTTPGLPAFPH